MSSTIRPILRRSSTRRGSRKLRTSITRRTTWRSEALADNHLEVIP